MGLSACITLHRQLCECSDSQLYERWCPVYQGFSYQFKGTKILCKQFNFKRKKDLMSDYFWSINEINVAACFLVFTFISKVNFTKLIKRLHQFTFKSEIKCFKENIVLKNTPVFHDLRENPVRRILLFFSN